MKTKFKNRIEWLVVLFYTIGIFFFFISIYRFSYDRFTILHMFLIGSTIIIIGIMSKRIKFSELPDLITKVFKK